MLPLIGTILSRAAQKRAEAVFAQLFFQQREDFCVVDIVQLGTQNTNTFGGFGIQTTGKNVGGITMVCHNRQNQFTLFRPYIRLVVNYSGDRCNRYSG